MPGAAGHWEALSLQLTMEIAMIKHTDEDTRILGSIRYDVFCSYRAAGTNDFTLMRNWVGNGRMTKPQDVKIDLSQVVSVYSGKNGRCCCGCSGKYTYAKQHQSWASKNRGYEVDDDEVNDRTVKLIVGKIERSRDAQHDGNDNVFTIIGDRLYVAFLKD